MGTGRDAETVQGVGTGRDVGTVQGVGTGLSVGTVLGGGTGRCSGGWLDWVAYWAGGTDLGGENGLEGSSGSVQD